MPEVQHIPTMLDQESPAIARCFYKPCTIYLRTAKLLLLWNL